MAKVLVAEDDQFLSKAYSAKLKKSGFEVMLANDGEEVMQKVKTEKPDIILLDLIMPKKDGFEVLAELKKDEKLKKIPVVVLSNLGQEEDITRGKKLGAVGYLVKSNIPISAVVEKINQILGIKA
ncbi:MAG: response regulator [Patescibacteria group bacterium]|jgi:DNA-binding response OmpR family regulator